MSRPLVAALAVFTLAFCACSSDEHHGHHGGGGSSGGTPTDRCAEAATCGVCTPVVGCGWCDYGGGKGACVSHPDACGTQEFRWTWEPAGCSTPADAGAPSDTTDATDASPATDTAVVPDTSTSEAGDASDASDASDTVETAKTCSIPGAGLNGCVPTTGGTACPSSDFTLGCHGSDPASIPAPAVSLGCKLASIPMPSGSLYYCCPCGS